MFSKDYFIYKHHKKSKDIPLKQSLMILFIFMCLFLLSLMSLSFAQTTKQILFISSYNSRFPTFFDQIDGLRAKLPKPEYEIDLEFMDTKRFNTPENTESFKERLAYKLSQNHTYDLVIVSDDNALRFALNEQDNLFKDIPIIFLGVNDRTLANEMNDNPLVTGVIEASSMYDTIATAMTLQPEANCIYAIVDDTLGGLGDYAEYEKYATAFPGLDFEALDLKTMTLEDLQTTLSQLSKEDIVLLLAAYSDSAGQVYSFEESLDKMVTASQTPIYHLYRHGVGQGLIGGKIISHYQQGLSAGNLALEVLKDQDAISKIKVIDNSPNIYIFDYKVLEQFNIDPDVIPEDATLLNEPTHLWETYFKEITAGIAIIFSLCIFIFYLIYYIRKAKTSEESLNVRTLELEDLYEELSASEEELRMQNLELLTTQRTLENQKSDLIKKQKQIEDYAYFDYLTRLPNRLSLKLDINNHLDKFGLELINGAVFFIDFDNFKQINDHYGHSAGDELLIEIATRLRRELSDYGKIYRFGGDEFVALIDASCDIETIEFVAEKLYARFKDAISINGNDFLMTFSMGIALIPIHGNTFDELIGSADMAMYSAKNEGKNQYKYFDESLTHQTDYYKTLKLALSDAFENDEMTLHYQSIYGIMHKNIHFLEAMLRWFSPIGNIPPNKFIPLVKEMGMMQNLSRYVIEEVFELCSILETTDTDVMLTVNLSTYELLNVLLASEIERLLLTKKIDSSKICFEISETSIETDFDLVKTQMDKLRGLGFKMIIDDFGSEYLSLNYLKKLPIDFVKINIDFFTDADANISIMQSLMDILEEMNIGVIVKGIESEAHLGYIKNFNYQYLQGHYYSYPVNKARAINLILDEDIKIYHRHDDDPFEDFD